jgi:hypothetical protein
VTLEMREAIEREVHAQVYQEVTRLNKSWQGLPGSSKARRCCCCCVCLALPCLALLRVCLCVGGCMHGVWRGEHGPPCLFPNDLAAPWPHYVFPHTHTLSPPNN